jgi:hypothetical protein
MLAFASVLGGPFVKYVTANEPSGQCGSYPLHVFVELSTAMAYVYLFLYNWMLMGPVPFKHRMRTLKVIFSLYTLVACAVYGSGAALLSLGRACADTSPMQYKYCQMQLVMFVLGLCVAAGKLGREWLEAVLERRHRAKVAALKNALRREAAAEPATGESEPASGGSPATGASAN